MHQVRFRLLLTFVFLKKHDINFRNIVWKYEKNMSLVELFKFPIVFFPFLLLIKNIAGLV